MLYHLPSDRVPGFTVCLYIVLSGDVVSFAIRPGTRALLGIPVELVCELQTDMEAVSVYRTETQNIDHQIPFAYCTAYGCKNSEARYHAEHQGKAVTVMIHRFDPYQDRTWWTCSSTGTEKQFYLYDESTYTLHLSHD